MTFQIYNQNYSVPELVREIGYKAIKVTEKGELNCVRPLGGDYPRFHIYITEKPDTLNFSVHLDQKKPSYGDNTAHSGDYDSEVVKEEVQRIKDIVFK